MRNTMLVTLVLAAAGAATIAGSGPAAAIDYPYCVQGRGVGIPGDCSYSSYAQCLASASGRGLYCNLNPRVAFGQQRRGRLVGPLRWTTSESRTNDAALTSPAAPSNGPGGTLFVSWLVQPRLVNEP